MSTESAAAVEVARAVTVPLSQSRAFELFTARMTDFWPREHSIGAAEIAQVVVAPRVGGRWFERGWMAANVRGVASQSGNRRGKWCCCGRSAPIGDSMPTSRPRSRSSFTEDTLGHARLDLRATWIATATTPNRCRQCSTPRRLDGNPGPLRRPGEVLATQWHDSRFDS